MPTAPSPSYQNTRSRAVPLTGWTRGSIPGRCLLLLLAVLLPAGLQAAPRDLENKVKAAFLFHFTKFVEWPPESLPAENSPLSICVLGDSVLEPLLAPLQNRRSGSHPLIVRHVETDGDFSACQLLYLPRQQAVHLQRILDRLASQPVLTVSSIADFAERGGMIGFVLRDNRVRLEMNLASTRRSGLQINAQLIEVCERVFDSGVPSVEGRNTP